MATWSEMFSVLTEPGGSFEIRGVRPGKASVHASHPDFTPASAATDVDTAKGPAVVQLVLMQGGRIEGSARKRDGSPLAGHTVAIWPAKPDPYMGGPQVVTGSDGTFSAEHVPAGTATVNLMASVGPGMFTSIQSAQVEVRDGQTTSIDLVSHEILISGHSSRSG